MIRFSRFSLRFGPDQSALLRDDHQIQAGSTCLKLLAEGEEAIYPDYAPTAETRAEIVASLEANINATPGCKMCQDMYSRPKKAPLERDVDVIAHHMKTK